MKFNITVEHEDQLIIKVSNGLDSPIENYRLTVGQLSNKAVDTAKECIGLSDLDIILIGIRNQLEKHIYDVDQN